MEELAGAMISLAVTLTVYVIYVLYHTRYMDKSFWETDLTDRLSVEIEGRMYRFKFSKSRFLKTSRYFFKTYGDDGEGGERIVRVQQVKYDPTVEKEYTELARILIAKQRNEKTR